MKPETHTPPKINRVDRRMLLLSILCVAMSAGGAALIVMGTPDHHAKTNATLFENVIVDQSLQLNSATPSTLSVYDASKKLKSYTGAALKNTDGATICTIGSDGLGNCNVAVAGAGTSGHLTVFQSAPPDNRTIGDYPGATCGAGTFANALNSDGTLSCGSAGSLSGSGSGITFWTGSGTLGSYSGSGCGAGSAIGTISGSGAATCIATGTGTVTSTGSAGFIPQFSTATNIANWTGSGCGAGSALTNLSGSGVATCAGFSANGTPSVSISHTTFSGPINLSTLGTIDWYDCGASTAPNSIPAYGQNFPHSKFNGGFIWRTAGFRGANATFTSGTDQTFTSTAADDQATNALSSNAYCDLFNTTGGIGFGEGMTVPADPAANRVLRIYWLTGSGCETTTTATLSDGTSNTDVINTGGGTTNYVITVTFHGKAAGDVLNVRVMITASTGSCALGWYAASLGSS